MLLGEANDSAPSALMNRWLQLSIETGKGYRFSDGMKCENETRVAYTLSLCVCGNQMNHGALE